MANPLTPLQPFPFTSFSVTLPDVNTLVELDPQPYTNTKEIILYNLSQSDSVLVKIVDLMAIPASGRIGFGATGGTNASGPPVVGDTITITGPGVPLTAVAGNQTSGANDFSAPFPAIMTITVPLLGLAGSGTIKISGGAVVPVLSGSPAGGAPGTQSFSTAGLGVAIAASIAAAINDPLNNMGWGVAVAAANVVTVYAYIGSNGSRQPSVVNENGIQWQNLSVATNFAGLVVTNYSPAVQAQVQPTSPIRATDGTYSLADVNTIRNVAYNVFTALRDPANVWANVGTPAAQRVDVKLSSSFYTDTTTPLAGSFTLVAYQAGTGGNAITYSQTSPFPPPPAVPIVPRIDVFAGTFSGGVDAVPSAASLTLANSLYLPASSAITLSIGSEGNRQPLGTSTYWSTNPGSGIGIVMRAGSGNEVVVNITYVQNRGYPEGF